MTPLSEIKAVLHSKMQPPHIVDVLGGPSRPTRTWLKKQGVDTHANGSKKEDEEKGEARREEKDDEAPEEEISDL